MTKFSDLKITFKKKNELAVMAAITAACIIGIGTVLHFVDTGAASVFSLLFV